MTQRLLLLLACVALSMAQITTTNLFPNGGLGTVFPVGPTNLNLPGISSNSFNLLVIPGQTTTVNLANGLINNDYNIYPLIGFSYEYHADNLPSWVNYYASNKSISISPPSNWTGTQNFNLTYSDARNNNASIYMGLSPGSNFAVNQLNFVSTNSPNTAANMYTLIFPLFTVINGNLSSIMVNSYGALTNVATRPWTNLVPVVRQSLYNGVQTQTTINNVVNSGSNAFLPGTGTVLAPGTLVFPSNNATVILPVNSQTTTTTSVIPATNSFVYSNPNNNGAFYNQTNTSTTTTTGIQGNTNQVIQAATPVSFIPTVITTPSQTSNFQGTSGNSIIFNPQGNGLTNTTTTTSTVITGPTGNLNNLNQIGSNTIPTIIPVVNSPNFGTTNTNFVNPATTGSFSSTIPTVVTVTPPTQTITQGANGQTIFTTTNQTSITGTPQAVNNLAPSFISQGTTTFPSNSVSPIVVSPNK